MDKSEQLKLLTEIWNQISQHPLETLFGAIVMLPMIWSAWENQKSMNKRKDDPNG